MRMIVKLQDSVHILFKSVGDFIALYKVLRDSSLVIEVTSVVIG